MPFKPKISIEIFSIHGCKCKSELRSSSLIIPVAFAVLVVTRGLMSVFVV